MTSWDGDRLSDPARRFAEEHLTDPVLVEDMSWGLVDTRVLHVATSDGHFVVKSAGPGNHHIGREISAHESATTELVSLGLTGRLVASDRARHIVITTYLDGRLADGTPFELDYDVHVQAGAALRALHSGGERVDDHYEARTVARAIDYLDSTHRIGARTEKAVRRLLAEYRPHPVIVVPTHGDWQPRNWLIDGTTLRVIDFGRFDHRPAATDLCRLAFQQWIASPDLEQAFLNGYGSDPREPDSWRVHLLCEAIGTAVWAHHVGDETFEAQGHRMLARAVRLFDS